MEKQLQQQLQQMANMQKQQVPPQANSQQNTQEMDKLRKDLQASIVEKDRFQAQLEMLVQELEKSQVVYFVYFFIFQFHY